MIYCMIGISGSGKTTLANNMVKYLEDAVIISRDKLREMLFGYTPENIQEYYQRDDMSENEKTVSKMQDALIRSALDQGKDVLVDNTHLRFKYVEDLKKYDVKVRFVPVEVDIQTAIKRDNERVKKVGEDVIRKQAEELEHLKKQFDFGEYEPTQPEQLGLRKVKDAWYAFVFDMDGTLALNKSGRSPYDWERVGEDVVNDAVKRTLRAIEDRGYRIIICSGRSDVCREQTRNWLVDNAIPYHELHMRENGDNRKDSVVKEEMWDSLTKRYNIVGMFDDRNQVVEHGRKLGFTVFQVADGNF